MIYKSRLSRPRSGFKMGMGITHKESVGSYKIKGQVTFDMRDPSTGESLVYWEKKNLIVNDAGILVARLLRDPTEPANGLNMLAVGTGGTGPALSPDAPDPRQRKLNSEIARKAFASTTYRDSVGAAVFIPTNIVDFTTTFGEAEAVGPLNEMALMSTISDNPSIKNPNPNTFPNYDPTVDLTQYDVIVNYLTFSVITKPSTAVLTITWRLTF